MAIPKIKIYRLDEQYNQSNDNDIQSLSNDQLLPVSIKNLNPNSTDFMVGVRERGDARMVVQSDWKIMEIQLNIGENISPIQTNPFICQGMVLGKGNMRLFLKKQLKNQSSSSGSEVENINDPFQICTQENGWYQIDRKCWDYEITSEKMIYVQNSSSSSEGEYYDFDEIENYKNDNVVFHKIDKIIFKIGNIIKQTNLLFNKTDEDAYNNCLSIESIGRIYVMYKTYDELYETSENFISNESTTLQDIHEVYNGLNDNLISRDINSDYSKFRVPFGNIYNGNKHGRCFTVNNGTSSVIHKSLLLQTDQQNTNYTNFYEGNYEFKRKIMPLRYLVSKQLGYESQFVADVNIYNNRSVFSSKDNWIYDGLMKPVLMQRITSPLTGKKIFKKLQQNEQFNYVYSNSNGNQENSSSVTCTFLDSYYSYGSNYYIPHEVFLFYNLTDDSLGNAFDFNYNYHEFFNQTDIYNPKSIINPYQNTTFGAYGYANRGNIIVDNQHVALFNNKNKIYKKEEILAVMQNYGYDADKDIQLNESSNSVNFIINEDTLIKFSEIASQFGFRLYIDGIKVYDSININNSSSSSLSQNDFQINFTVNSNNLTCVITKINQSINLPKDVMLVYYKKLSAEFTQNKNPDFLGYRIPCYEKVKKAKIFVSSFPNWVKGHLNNDLDVFVGNKKYEGTLIDGTNFVDAVYPQYQNDGWYPSYDVGSIQFADEIEEVNYFDLLNYSPAIEIDDWSKFNSSILSDFIPNTHDFSSALKIYLNKVRYNVAYYDGIYTITRGKLSNYSVQNGKSYYALLEDDDFAEQIGKKWLVRSDENIKMLFETGVSYLPQIDSVYQSEQATLVDDVGGKDGILQGNIIKLGFKSNRIVPIFFVVNNGINESIYNRSMIIAIDKDSSQDVIQLVNSSNLDESLLRVHLRIKNDLFYVGIEHDPSCFESSSSSSCQHNGNVIYGTTPDYFKLENIRWEVLRPMENCYGNQDNSSSSSQIQTFDSLTQNRQRFIYSNELWKYDLCIQVFSYRYNQDLNFDGKRGVSGVEYIVYKVDK